RARRSARPERRTRRTAAALVRQLSAPARSACGHGGALQQVPECTRVDVRYRIKTAIIPVMRGLALCTTLFASTTLFAAEGSGHFGLVSLLPPVMAIALALILRQVVPALFVGIWIGAWALHDFSLAGLWSGLLETFEVHIVD